MRNIITTIVIVVLLHIRISLQAQSSLSTTKHLTYPGKDLILDFTIGENITFFYALCDRAHLVDKRKCNLLFERLFMNGLIEKNNCTMDLNSESEDTKFDDKYKLEKFGQDSIIFAWKTGEIRKTRHSRDIIPNILYFKELLNIRVVNMTTCKFKETSIVIDETNSYSIDEKRIKNLNIVPLDNNTVHIFYRNKMLCGTQRRCVLSYSVKDQQFNTFDIQNPFTVLTTSYDVSADVSLLSSSKDSKILAYVIKNSFRELGSIDLISTEGQPLLSYDYSWSESQISKGIINLSSSQNQGNLTICRQPRFTNVFRCSQYNHTGKMTLDMSITMKSINATVTDVHNLPGGGFMILIGYAKEEESEGSLDILDLSMVDPWGNFTEFRGMKNIKCPLSGSKVTAKFFDRDDFQYCFYFACTWPSSSLKSKEDEYHMKLYSECFPSTV